MFEPIRPKLSLLSQPVVERVVAEAFEVLARTGVIVENAEAVELLQAAGAQASGRRTRIRAEMIASALSSAPASLVLYDRQGAPAVRLEGDRSHFDPGSAALKIYDHRQGGLRHCESSDCFRFTKLVQMLPNFAAQSTGIIPQNLPQEVSDSFRLWVALRYGTKPVVTGTFCRESFDVMHSMLTAVRGSAQALRDKPLAIFDCCPSPPLKWSDLTCHDLICAARAGVPAELVSMPLAGATAPVTLLAAVVQHCAENLSGVVIHQLAAPGSPIIYGGSPAMFDMRHATTPMGATETMMMDAAYAQVGKHLGLPVHAYMGLSDSKKVDAQAGLESAAGAVLAVLAGVNMISGPGMLDFENCQSLEKLIIDHEICGMALRLAEGITPRDEPFAASLLADLQPDADFLSHPHTKKWYRQETYYPGPVIDRMTAEASLAAGGKCAVERAAKIVEQRLAEYQFVALGDDVDRELESIMSGRLEAFGVKLADHTPPEG